MKRLSKKVNETLSANDFRICSIEEQRGNYVAELEWYSPAGEDFIMVLWFVGTSADFIREFGKYAEDFDPEEHAAMWIENRNSVSGVPSIRELIDDADEIKETLMRVAAELAA